MNLAIAAAVFPVIFLGELPDKTMIASVALSARSRALPVWLGAAAGFTVHVVIATTIGVVLFRLLPHQAVAAAVAALFLAGAGLAVWEAVRSREEPGQAAGRAPARGPAWRPGLTAFTVIFVAEWGDLTQLLIANLTAHYHSALPVGIGSLLALWVVAALAVLGGQGVLRLVNATVLRLGTAALLAGFGAYAGWAAFA